MRLGKKLTCVLFMAMGIGGFEACQQHGNKLDTNHESDKTSINNVIAVKFQDAGFDSVFRSYSLLKDALVKSDVAEASKNASQLALKLAKAGSEKLVAVAEKIQVEKDIKKQRIAFTELSNQMITWAKKAPLATGTVYVQHCPMANNGDGGDWLSIEQKVKNPYYGSDMLECGAVVETIKSPKK